MTMTKEESEGRVVAGLCNLIRLELRTLSNEQRSPGSYDADTMDDVIADAHAKYKNFAKLREEFEIVSSGALVKGK